MYLKNILSIAYKIKKAAFGAAFLFL